MVRYYRTHLALSVKRHELGIGVKRHEFAGGRRTTSDPNDAQLRPGGNESPPPEGGVAKKLIRVETGGSAAPSSRTGTISTATGRLARKKIPPSLLSKAYKLIERGIDAPCLRRISELGALEASGDLKTIESWEVRKLSREIDNLNQKVAPRTPRVVFSPPEYSAGTEPITSKNARHQFPKSPDLPDAPPRMWPGRTRGRPFAESGNPLIQFLEEVYGPYLPAQKDHLRNYIRKHDPKLYDAIHSYEKKAPLPTHLQMTTVNDRHLARLEMAKAAGFVGFTEGQRVRAEAQLAKLAAKPKGSSGPK